MANIAYSNAATKFSDTGVQYSGGVPSPSILLYDIITTTDTGAVTKQIILNISVYDTAKVSELLPAQWSAPGRWRRE